MFNEFESFVDNLKPDCVLTVRISDNVLEPEDWPIDGLTLVDGVVVGQLHLIKGAYRLPNMEGWTTQQLMEWTQYDPVGSHPEQYYEISKH